MEIQLDILFIVVITYIVSALFTILIMKTSHRKEINKLEKEIVELNWYILEQDKLKE